MKRLKLRLTATTIAGYAVLAGLVVLVVAVWADFQLALSGAGWAVPLFVGGTAGLLSWSLLTDHNRGGQSDAKRFTVHCGSCGTEVLEDWRLCPYCGGSNEPGSPEGEAPSVTSQVEG